MEIKSKFDHFNINVTDLNRSITFYQEALGLTEIERKVAPDGRYILVYLGDGEGDFRLELTFLKEQQGAYNLGDNESHLCMRVAGDYAAVRAHHHTMGCICYQNEEMGLYFIADPDDYWIEILPLKR
ncbi:MAG: VOC family protein [Alistipes sp.]